MTKGTEDLLNMIKVAVYEAFDAKEDKLNNICEKNVISYLRKHELECPSRSSKFKSIINWSSFTGVFGLIIEKVINHSGK